MLFFSDQAFGFGEDESGPTHKKIIESDYKAAEVSLVMLQLNKLTPSHTMGSEINLSNTIDAILKLSNGKIEELTRLVEVASIDFRDVVYWASLES